ncbi:hypothetical protein OAT16_11780, partial [Prolixibacteraceae bacterium]|nr:hypothetical protein [Prolixibacteraceae bacterium]
MQTINIVEPTPNLKRSGSICNGFAMSSNPFTAEGKPNNFEILNLKNISPIKRSLSIEINLRNEILYYRSISNVNQNILSIPIHETTIHYYLYLPCFL